MSARPSGSGSGDLPTDAAAVRALLKTMGVEAHEPRVLHMLLDFMYSYVSGVLSDASAFAQQVGRPPGEVEEEDVSLAVQSRCRHSFVPHPQLEAIRALADQVNERRLPDLDPLGGLGLRLPPEEHLLVQPGFRIEPPPPPRPGSGR